MKNIKFVANILGIDGYSSHGRQLVNALYDLKKYNIKIETLLQPGWETVVNDAELNMITNKTVTETEDFISIFIGLPPQYRMILADNPKEFYGYIVWEGDSIPPYWLKHLQDKRITGLIVPSNHTKQAILNTVSRFNLLEKDIAPIHVIPHGANTALFRPDLSRRTPKFSFIVSKGWRLGINDRGGVQWAIKAFCEEFKKDEDVEMYIKINPIYCPPNFDLTLELEKLNLPPKEQRPKLFITMDAVDYKILPNWYNQGHVLVAPNMSEAFGLNHIEAMACGLPVITTNFGGQTDYINNENGWLIDTELVDVTWDMQYESIRWGLPNLIQLKKIMRDCFNNQELVKHKAIKALETTKDYTWYNSAKKLSEVIK